MANTITTPEPSPDGLQTTFPQSLPAASSAGPSSSSRRPLLPTSYPPKPRHPGCVLCSLVVSASSLPSPRASTSARLQPHPAADGGDTLESPTPTPTAATTFLAARSDSRPSAPASTQPYDGSESSSGETMNVGGRDILYHDEEITVYPAVGKERLCSDGRHLVVVVNRHLESVYDLGPHDIPLLSHMLDTAHRLLTLRAPIPISVNGRVRPQPQVRVGFVGSVMKDPQSPHAHLHAHALLGDPDTSLPGASFFRRNVVFGALNWWSIEDLRAEIRESTSNNRVKSGYVNRTNAPIDAVPDAGSTTGLPNALDSTDEYTDNPLSRRRSSNPRNSVPAAPAAQVPSGLVVPREESGSGGTAMSSPVMVDRPVAPPGSSENRALDEGASGFVAVELETEYEGKGKGKAAGDGPL